jgi:signal transduction histidine kinase
LGVLPLRNSLAAAMDDRTSATVRLCIASAALAIICLDPAESERHVAEALAFYTGYSALLYVLSRRRGNPVPAHLARLVDVGWSLLLVFLSDGTTRMFFTAFFLFAILIASFRWGLTLGLREVLGLVMLLIVICIGATREPGFDVNHLFRRPTYLLMVGYMMAFWGDSEIQHRRRLALLREVGATSNLRFGLEQTMDSLTERLRSFYNADTCLLRVQNPATGEASTHRADCPKAGGRARARHPREDVSRLLEGLPTTQAIVYRGRRRGPEWLNRRSAVWVYDLGTGKRTRTGRELNLATAREPFVTVPFRARAETRGRLTLAARHRLAFDSSELEFLLQVLSQAMATLENIRLVDRLASDAAEVERRRIAHDVHDSVIQPYVGLQMGLEGIRRKLDAGANDVGTEIDRLLRLTEIGIADLRDYTSHLKEAAELGGSLVSAMRRYAEKFTTATGITVHVEAAEGIRVNDRLAAEAFQIAAEGLSNVRRHTRAKRATVALARREDFLVVRIENQVAGGSGPAPFIPRSITERTAALGGGARIERTEGGDTAVIVEIPL